MEYKLKNFMAIKIANNEYLKRKITSRKSKINARNNQNKRIIPFLSFIVFNRPMSTKFRKTQNFSGSPK